MGALAAVKLGRYWLGSEENDLIHEAVRKKNVHYFVMMQYAVLRRSSVLLLGQDPTEKTNPHAIGKRIRFPMLLWGYI